MTAPENELESAPEEEAIEEGIELPDDLTGESEDETPKLSLEVQVTEPSACERHVVVTVPREDVDRYFEKTIGELAKTVAVPGFRIGRAPKKLVQSRFKKDAAEQVKNSILIDALQQVTDEQDFSAISEPDLKPDAVVLPDQGPMTFEFTIEVRPDFEMPEWQGLSIDLPVREITDEDVSRHLGEILIDYGRLVPFDGPASADDYVVTNITFKYAGAVLTSGKEETIRIRPTLSFHDGVIGDFGHRMVGVKAGESRVLKAVISEDAPNEQIRGRLVDAVFDVLEIKRAESPELTPELLGRLGDFQSEEDFRRAVRASLHRKLAYAQQKQVRKQILEALTKKAAWELPPRLLQSQFKREFERSILELQRSGFSEAEINAHSNQLRQNVNRETARALKEHFVLERLAEEMAIDASEADFADEIRLIADESGDTPRRVRAHLEKQNMMDVLRNQIVERKAIDLIIRSAKIREVPFQFQAVEAEAVDQTVGGGEQPESLIPEAKPESGSPEPTYPKEGQP
jgi:trigger factor